MVCFVVTEGLWIGGLVVVAGTVPFIEYAHDCLPVVLSRRNRSKKKSGCPKLCRTIMGTCILRNPNNFANNFAEESMLLRLLLMPVVPTPNKFPSSHSFARESNSRSIVGIHASEPKRGEGSDTPAARARSDHHAEGDQEDPGVHNQGLRKGKGELSSALPVQDRNLGRAGKGLRRSSPIFARRDQRESRPSDRAR